jgi:hypothetical protein
MSIAVGRAKARGSFLKKRTKKLPDFRGAWLMAVATRDPQTRLHSKSFLVLFFKKAPLPSFFSVVF